MTKLLNGDDPNFAEISPVITTLRHDLDQKIKRLADALATLGLSTTELEKVRIALEGTSPTALVSTVAHDTCVPIPAQAVIDAKKQEIMRALESADNAFEAVRESIDGVLNSASLPDTEVDARIGGAARIRFPQLLQSKNPFRATARDSTSLRLARGVGFSGAVRPALARWLPN
jgi:hypothetical protein